MITAPDGHVRASGKQSQTAGEVKADEAVEAGSTHRLESALGLQLHLLAPLGQLGAANADAQANATTDANSMANDSCRMSRSLPAQSPQCRLKLSRCSSLH